MGTSSDKSRSTQQLHTTTTEMNRIIFTFTFLLSVSLGQKLPDVLTREGATTLVDFVVKAGLAETLSGDGPFTIFAPTNEAFEKLPQSVVDQLMADPEAWKKVLLYHVIPAEIKSSDIELDDALVASAEGTKLRVNTYMKKFYYDGFLTVNGKRISRTDIVATNGVVHFITDVIDTPAIDDCTKVLTDDGRFGTLLTADSLDTILTDNDLLTSTLLRQVVPQAKFARGIVWEFLDTAGGDKIATHVFKGGYTKVISENNGNRVKAKIVDADLICSNGVIHAIDTVI